MAFYGMSRAIGKYVKKDPSILRVLGVGRGVYWMGAFIGGFIVDCLIISIVQLTTNYSNLLLVSNFIK